MPAPAVIPAPRAYINAVAVKGFVVELRVLGFMLVQSPFASCKVVAPTPDTREHSETNTTGFCFLPTFLAYNARRVEGRP